MVATSDLAILYGCKNGTKTINQAVKRNINKFPNNFYFQLTNEEYKYLKSQIGTSSSNNYGGVRKMPYVFTEHGVAMLSSVLNTKVADEISVKIINVFVAMRHIFIDNINYQKELFIIQNKILEHDNKLLEHDSEFNEIFGSFGDKLNHIYYEGETYDAYSIIMDIFNMSKKEIIIIDNYASKEILDMLKDIIRVIKK